MTVCIRENNSYEVIKLTTELVVQYVAVAAALFALFIDYKGMKPFLPVALFASLYANVFCYIANYFGWWEFPVRLMPHVKDISFAANVITIPILAMFWIRYSPIPRIHWALLWSVILTGFEYWAVKNTAMIAYGNGYVIYYSFVLWLISWYIWYKFHHWYIGEPVPKNKS